MNDKNAKPWTERLPARPGATSGSPYTSTRLPERRSPDAPATPSRPLDSLVSQVRDLPALPAVALQIMQATHNDNGSARELAQCIARDPGFTARLLKLANSAYYGMSRNVGTIIEAVTLLGNRTVRNMAIIAATHETLGREVIGYELGQGDLWRHSLACGMAAQMLAEQTHYPEAEGAFVAGLLHDVGKVILGLYVRDRIAEIVAWMETNESTFLEAERAVLGFDHAEVGGRVALHWNLPVPLAQAIAWHHQPVQNGQIATLAALVHVANAICLSAGIGLGVDGLRTTISAPAMTALNLTEVQAEQVLDRLVSRIAEARPLFTLQSLI